MLSWEDLVALKKAGSFGGLEKGKVFFLLPSHFKSCLLARGHFLMN